MSTRRKPAGPVDGYEWDVFLSYIRSGASGEWVQKLFYPTLQKWLDANSPKKVRIFYDETIEESGLWPAVLKRGLLRSRCMVAVVSPPYFESNWCKAEWASLRARERALKLWTPENPMSGLIHGVVFTNPDGLPVDAKKRQMTDFTNWNISGEFFAGTLEYQKFVKAVQKLSLQILARLPQSPKFNKNWPVKGARVTKRTSIAQPRLI
ncbi:MAG TPA: toll/interleukin-1 receptor domain-containing protein [Thermoanaerobaculia bacterium]|nr:toll/interleukin-1 receptor domain-containing protein [Thermoanaerobaculia bacterium]